MKTAFGRFLVSLIVFGGIIFFTGSAGLKSIFKTSDSTTLAGLVLFFSLVTALVHYSLISIERDNHKKFVNVFLLTTALKLFIYLIIVTIYAFFNKQNAVSFVLIFFTLYLLYTVFELVYLFRFFKTKKADN